MYKAFPYLGTDVEEIEQFLNKIVESSRLE